MNFKTEQIEIDEKVYTLLIGLDAAGNDQIIKDSHPEDLWFHAEDVSSCHVILQGLGKVELDKRWLYQVAKKVVENTRFKNINNIIYTRIKNVRQTHTPGMVLLKTFLKLKL